MNGRSPQRKSTNAATNVSAVSTTASTAAARSQVTCGSQCASTNSSPSRQSTSKSRSTTTVAVASTIDVPDVRFSATTRAASPARAGSTLLTAWPRSVASSVGPYAGRVGRGKRYCQRSARMPWAAKSSRIAGSAHQ